MVSNRSKIRVLASREEFADVSESKGFRNKIRIEFDNGAQLDIQYNDSTSRFEIVSPTGHDIFFNTSNALQKYSFTANGDSSEITLPGGAKYQPGKTMLFSDGALWTEYAEVQNSDGTYTKIKPSDNYPLYGNCVLFYWESAS
jgi:hypothetical protein